jgi:hypothetical protein
MFHGHLFSNGCTLLSHAMGKSLLPIAMLCVFGLICDKLMKENKSIFWGTNIWQSNICLLSSLKMA